VVGPKKMTSNPWEGVPKNIEDYEAFVYEITNLTNGRKYIGKKIFWAYRKLKPLKGKKRKRIVKKESDWRSYYGSSIKLLEDIQRLGEDKFRRRILHAYRTRWESSYHEARLQFENAVLLDDNYYNGIINCRIGKPPKEVGRKTK